MEMTETLSECALKVRERECQVRMRLRNHIRKCVRVFVAEYGAQIEKCGHVLIATYKHGRAVPLTPYMEIWVWPYVRKYGCVFECKCRHSSKSIYEKVGVSLWL